MNFSEFRKRHQTLVWANPGASEEIWIRSALVRPQFECLLDAVLTFGLARVEREWEILLSDGDPDALRARSTTDRMMGNIRLGHQRALA